MSNSFIVTPLPINNVQFKNRILRSSVGGRMFNYDGTVTDVWINSENRFAAAAVGRIISTTFHVNKDRVSPRQYPSIADPKFVPYLKKFIAGIKQRSPDCRYIVQIGDPGYTTYMSLFPKEQDSKSSSGFDLGFGYNNTRTMMSNAEIEKAIIDFADAAERVNASGADGLEITATKDYLIHQFLSPGINRRSTIGVAVRTAGFACCKELCKQRATGSDATTCLASGSRPLISTTARCNFPFFVFPLC